jgi:hypothetical protein
MENDFDLDVFLENLAEEQLFKSVSPKHQEQELEFKRQLEELGKQRATEQQQQHSGARPNPIVPEFPQPWPYGDPPSRAMKKPVDEKGYPFVSQADAARILDIDRKAAIFSGNGVIKIEREKISGTTKSPRIWIRLTDLKKYLETRDPKKANKIGKCLTDIDEFRALATQNGFKLRVLGSDYDRPEFYQNLI